MVVAQDDLFLVGSGLLRNELEYQLFTLAHLECAFLLAELEAWWVAQDFPAKRAVEAEFHRRWPSGKN